MDHLPKTNFFTILKPPMFPNVKAIPVSKMAGRAVLESSVEFAGVVYQMVGIYLASKLPTP